MNYLVEKILERFSAIRVEDLLVSVVLKSKNAYHLFVVGNYSNARNESRNEITAHSILTGRGGRREGLGGIRSTSQGLAHCALFNADTGAQPRKAVRYGQLRDGIVTVIS